MNCTVASTVLLLRVWCKKCTKDIKKISTSHRPKVFGWWVYGKKGETVWRQHILCKTKHIVIIKQWESEHVKTWIYTLLRTMFCFYFVIALKSTHFLQWVFIIYNILPLFCQSLSVFCTALRIVALWFVWILSLSNEEQSLTLGSIGLHCDPFRKLTSDLIYSAPINPVLTVFLSVVPNDRPECAVVVLNGLWLCGRQGSCRLFAAHCGRVMLQSERATFLSQCFKCFFFYIYIHTALQFISYNISYTFTHSQNATCKALQTHSPESRSSRQTLTSMLRSYWVFSCFRSLDQLKQAEDPWGVYFESV